VISLVMRRRTYIVVRRSMGNFLTRLEWRS
jgi:hypothetical protein